MKDADFKKFLKETKNPIWAAPLVGMAGIFGIPLFGIIFNVYPPLFDYLWAGSWGFLFGSVWQNVYSEREKEISNKLTKQIQNSQEPI